MWIIVVILIVIIFVILNEYNKLRESNWQDANKYYDERITQLESGWQRINASYEERKAFLNKTISQNEELIAKQKSQYDELIEQGQKIIDKELQVYKTKQQKELEIEYTEKKNKLLNEIKEQSTTLNNNLKKKEEENKKIVEQMVFERQQIEADLEDYRRKRASVTKAIIREKEIQEQEFFYKIMLTKNDIDDISVLRSIEPQLRNKEALNKLIFDVFIKLPMSEMIKRVTKGNKISGIYKITYTKTGEAYIGRSVDIGSRWKQHCLSSLNIGTIAHSTFHNFLAEKGLQNFTWEILEEVDKDKLNERERYWIDFYETDKQLNQKRGG